MKPEHVKYLLTVYVEDGGKDERQVSNHGRSRSRNGATFPDHNILSRQVACDDFEFDDTGIAAGPRWFQRPVEPQAPLPPEQVVRVREFTRKLTGIARQYETDRVSSRSPPVAREAQELQTEGLCPEEIQVVRNLHLAGPSATISTMVTYVNDKLTSRTFNVALHYLCSRACSYQEELALAFQLSKLLLPRARRDMIYKVVAEFFQPKPDLDEVLRME